MPRTINPDLCVSCGSCADVCPVSAISAGDAAYVINPDECIDCGACEGTCPQRGINLPCLGCKKSYAAVAFFYKPRSFSPLATIAATTAAPSPVRWDLSSLVASRLSRMK